MLGEQVVSMEVDVTGCGLWPAASNEEEEEEERKNEAVEEIEEHNGRTMQEALGMKKARVCVRTRKKLNHV